MNKHTPGPWQIEFAEDIDLPNHVGISAKKHSLLAQVVWCMENDERTPHCEANARLIAAAPDLLEALCKLAELYDAMGAPRGPCRIIADAAIAKAIGDV
jgi:hypothetical protein